VHFFFPVQLARANCYGMTQDEFLEKWRSKFLELIRNRAGFLPPASPTWNLLICTFAYDSDPENPNPGGFNSKKLYKFGGYDTSFTSQNPIHQWFRFADFLRGQHYYTSASQLTQRDASFYNSCYQFATGKGQTDYGLSANFEQAAPTDGSGRNYANYGIPADWWYDFLTDQLQTEPRFPVRPYFACKVSFSDDSAKIPLFFPLGPRKPRYYGQKDSKSWREFVSEWKTGKKFTKQTKKLVATPNERGFGKEGTEEWKDKLLRGAKGAIGRVAKDAIKSAVDKAVEEGGKRVVRKTLTKALGDRLKKIDDWSKRKD